MPDTEPQITTLEGKQEQLTQEYDKFLTKTEDLENNPNVSIDEFTTTSGKKVKRYNLVGADFAFLSHTVGLNIDNDNLTTSKDINENISTWNKTKKGEANNQISCSLISHDHIAHPFSRNRTPIILGFNHLENNDLLATAGRDAGAVVKGVDISMDMFHMDSPEKIIKTPGYGSEYNEVVISRYSSDGQTARQPNFIITFDGQISDQIQQAIDYFHIPVVNFQTNGYIEKANQQINTILSQINPNNPLDEQKEIFSQIPYLVVNRDNWELFSLRKRTSREDNDIYQKLSQIEESITEQQLVQDQETLNLATEKLKTDITYESLQEFHKTLTSFLNNHSYEQERPQFLFEANRDLMIKWISDSDRTVRQIMSSIAPDIINFYQERSVKLSQQTGLLTIDQLHKELQNFEKSSMIIEISQQLMLRGLHYQRGHELGYNISQDRIETEQQYPETASCLQQIYLAQEQLQTQISSKIKQVEQKAQQDQVDFYNASLLNSTSNFDGMVELLQSHNNEYEFHSQILTKIKEYLTDDSREITKIITDFRNHQELLKTYPELLYQAFGDGYDNEIYRLLSNPAKSPTVPKRITLSDTTIIDNSQELKITSFIDSNGQNQLFEIYPEIGQTKSLEKPNNKPTQDIIDNLNKKWLWRLRKHLPQFDISNTYQLNPESTKQLLVTTETDFYLINGQAVQKIKMSEFNIRPINQYETRQAY